MTTVQMNTRIDGELKAAGDAVLESVGFTPTRAVRALWGFAARNELNSEAVEELLNQAEGPSASEDDERKRKARLAEAGPANFESFLKDMGIGDIPTFAENGLSPADAREQAALERAAQKGWING